MDSTKAYKQIKLQAIDQFVDKHGLSKDLYNEMKQEITQDLWGSFEGSSMGIIRRMPNELLHKVCLNMYDCAFTRIYILRYQDIGFINYIMPRLVYEEWATGCMIYSKGDQAEAIYFISTGRVSYIINETSKVFKCIPTGSYFGDIEIIEEIPRMFNVVAHEFTTCLLMTRNWFEEVSLLYTHIAAQFRKEAELRKKKNETAINEVLDYAETVEIKKDFTPAELGGMNPEELFYASNYLSPAVIKSKSTNLHKTTPVLLNEELTSKLIAIREKLKVLSMTVTDGIEYLQDR